MEIVLVAQPVAASLNGANLVVEAFDEAQRDLVLRPTGRRDAIPIPLDHRREVLERLQPLRQALRSLPSGCTDPIVCLYT
jgi:hypothetical protein